MIEVVHPSDELIPQIKQLFRNYPYKFYQQRKQRLDPETLAQCFLENYRGAMAQSDSAHFLAMERGEVLGLAALAPDVWHASVYDLAMAKVSYFLCYERVTEVGQLLLEQVLRTARLRSFNHLSCRLDANEWNLIHLLEKSGFYIVDCSMKLSCDVKSLRTVNRASVPGLQVAPLESAHVEDVLRIASSAHQYNHFYADPSLPRHLTNELFRRWVKRCIDGLAKWIYVALLEESVVGFVTFLENSRLNTALNTRIGILDFIVLDTPYQRRGLGTPFLDLALQALRGQYDMIELRTSHNNYPALNLYEKFGFQHVSSDVILHCLV